MTTVTCDTCQQPIETAEGYLVATEDGLQITQAADPKVGPNEDALHLVCPEQPIASCR